MLGISGTPKCSNVKGFAFESVGKPELHKQSVEFEIGAE